ncbi:hypothetical protein [Noviherbaspirillum sp. Root189]|uniref:hypothetical protein n=1 Tax=Noviherbaspirillum sp. Root189 TaxID=1736487 RepID=UPI00070B091E|nr:hypothetical protein [Noviherbaspirillum sp. Root189]KRB87870.1 hypothetical protein ASE07_19200 [Noviherbaspirillum sp. Root189]
MLKRYSWRLADVLTMAMLAIPLVGCADAVGDSRHARQPRSVPNPNSVSQRAADRDKEVAVTHDATAAGQQLIQAELRHFHVYQHYRAVTSAMDEPVMRKPDSAKDDVRVQHAAMTFSERRMDPALSDCPLPTMTVAD